MDLLLEYLGKLFAELPVCNGSKNVPFKQFRNVSFSWQTVMLSEACFEADVLRLADWEEKEKEKEEEEENMQSFGGLNL